MISFLEIGLVCHIYNFRILNDNPKDTGIVIFSSVIMNYKTIFVSYASQEKHLLSVHMCDKKKSHPEICATIKTPPAPPQKHNLFFSRESKNFLFQTRETNLK